MTRPAERPGFGAGTTKRLSALVLGLLMHCAGQTQALAETPTYSDIAPLFADRCVLCHNGAAAPLGLELTSYAAVLKGGTNGPVLVGGDPSGSELLRRVRGDSLPRMPMTGPPFLSDAEIDMLERWVEAGMPEGGASVADSSDEHRESETESETTAPPPPSAAELLAGNEPVTYDAVAPLFARRCAKCHTDDGLMGPPPEGYRLTSYAATLSPADRVRVVPGSPGASELVRRIRGHSLPRMPFDGPPYLEPDDIALIERWIADGARDSEGRPAQPPIGARVRLQGTLDGRWSLDGLTLHVGRDTRIDKNPGVGDYVEVRGRVGREGWIQVERLRRR